MRVPLYPDQMNSNYYNHLKNNLRGDVQGKCNKYGYVMDIFSILSHTDGSMEPEDFKGVAKFDVKFSCRLCRPVVNTGLICRLVTINRAIIKAENGPILVVIAANMINDQQFRHDNNGELINRETNQVLRAGDLIRVTIKRFTPDKKNNRLATIAYLDGIATEEEEAMFKQDLGLSGEVSDGEDSDGEDDESEYI